MKGANDNPCNLKGVCMGDTECGKHQLCEIKQVWCLYRARAYMHILLCNCIPAS